LGVSGVFGSLVFRAAASAAEMIETDVRNDAVHPGVETALEAKSMQILVNLDESFLIDIARVLGFV
jgi:hypothetical protein